MTLRKIILLLSLLVLGISPLQGQDSIQFLYIQSDQSQLFYVKMDGQLLSSASGGYLIIPRLHAGEKTLVVGFPKNEYPEQQFQVRIEPGKDRGFLLRKDPENEFVLYDLNDFRMLKGAIVATSGGIPKATLPATTATRTDSTPLGVASAPPPAPGAAPASPDNGFRNLLAAVTHQELPREAVPSGRPVKRQKRASPPSSGAPAGITQRAVSKPGPEHATPSAPDTSVQSVAPGTLTRPLDSAATAIVDPFAAGNGKDTAATSLENMDSMEIVLNGKVAQLDSAVRGIQKGNAPVSTVASQADSLPGGARGKITGDSREQPSFLNFSTTVPGSPDSNALAAQTQGSAPAPGQSEEGVDSNSAVPMVNSDCTNLIKEEKFIMVRRKMALESNPDLMLNLASRYFAEDCYTVEQIQSLTFLFNNDDYRYRLLEMAYPHTYDTDHFGRLIHTLSDPYYIGRFKAMLKR